MQFKSVLLFQFGESGFSYKSARKSPRKREILIVQVEFGKIISIERTELYVFFARAALWTWFGLKAANNIVLID